MDPSDPNFQQLVLLPHAGRAAGWLILALVALVCLGLWQLHDLAQAARRRQGGRHDDR